MLHSSYIPSNRCCHCEFLFAQLPYAFQNIHADSYYCLYAFVISFFFSFQSKMLSDFSSYCDVVPFPFDQFISRPSILTCHLRNSSQKKFNSIFIWYFPCLSVPYSVMYFALHSKRIASESKNISCIILQNIKVPTFHPLSSLREKFILFFIFDTLVWHDIAILIM